MSNLTAGTDTSNRLGRRIRVKRIAFAGQALGGQTNSVADDPYDTLRIVVFRTLPGFTFASFNVNSFIDPRYQPGLLEVLYDHTEVLNVYGKDSTGYVARAMQWEFNLPTDILIEYQSSGAAAPVNQQILAYAVSDSVAVVNPGFSAGSTFLLEFIDEV